MPSVLAREDNTGITKKQSVMGRLKSKLSNIGTNRGKKDTSPNDGENIGQEILEMTPSQSELCNQNSTPRLESSTDMEHNDEMDHVEENGRQHGEPRDEECTASSENYSNNEHGITGGMDDEKNSHAPTLNDLVIVGKSPSKLHSPSKRFFPSEPRNSNDNLEPNPLLLSEGSPPESKNATENLCPSPLKRTSVHPSEKQTTFPAQENNSDNMEKGSTDQPVVKPTRKSRAPAFNENAPILASASAGVAEELAIASPEANMVPDSKNENDFDAGAAITNIFGERVARMLGADPWGDRQDGFDAISLFVKKLDPAATNPLPSNILCAALAAINCGVSDRVAPVMYCSLECLINVLTSIGPIAAKSKRFMHNAALPQQVSLLQTSLLAKLNDSNKRTQREAIHGLVRLAKVPKLQTLNALMAVFESEPLDKSRLELIQELITEFGFNEMTATRVLAWTVPALKISDDKTRKLALDISANVILNSADQQAALESLTGIKPAMLKVLQRRMEEIKTSQAAPSANQLEPATPENEEEKVEIWIVPRDDDVSITTLLANTIREAENLAGPVAWRKLESKTWSDRKEALVDIEKAVEEHKTDLRDVKPVLGSPTQQQYMAYNALIHHLLNDSIAPVVNQSIDFYSTLIKIYGPHIDWRDTSIKDLTMQSIMRLLAGMQKPNNRTSKGSCRAILKLARMNTNTMQCVIACVFAKDAEPLVQMQVLRLLIPEFGLTTDPSIDVPGVNLNSTLVLNAVAAALAHSNEKVRKGAMDVALCTQRIIGKTKVLKRLKDIKPSTLKELEKNFIDIEPPTTERPSTVQQQPTVLGSGLGEVTASRRLLSSAPVAGGKVHDDGGAMDWTPRGDSILSKDEESFMNSILDG